MTVIDLDYVRKAQLFLMESLGRQPCGLGDVIALHVKNPSRRSITFNACLIGEILP